MVTKQYKGKHQYLLFRVVIENVVHGKIHESACNHSIIESVVGILLMVVAKFKGLEFGKLLFAIYFVWISQLEKDDNIHKSEA